MARNKKNRVEEHIYNTWKKRWTDSARYKHTIFFYDGPDKNKSKGLLKRSTVALNLWVKCITGHNNLAYFKSKVDPLVNPLCRLCGRENETVHHLLATCDAMYNKRQEIGIYETPSGDRQWSIKKLETFLNLPIIIDMLSYDTSYEFKEIIYQEHNYPSDTDSL